MSCNTLNIIQTIASVVAASSFFVALVTYFYNKNINKTLSVIDLISFFRKEIISAGDEFVRFVRKEKGEDYILSRVQLDNPTVEYTRNNFIEETKKQVDLNSDLKTISRQTLILNMLEEFSLKAKHLKVINHRALNSIKSVFIELVEINAVILLMQREVFTGISIYSTLLEIYSIWKNDIDRRSPEIRFQELKKRLGL